MRVEHPVEAGASDAQWRALLASRGIRLKNDTKPWGPLARRDFLNMLENEHPDRMPVFFDSKDTGETPPSSMVEDEDLAPDRLLMALELLRSKPGATDLEVAAALGLKTQGVARMWKIKAREVLESEGYDANNETP